MRNKIPRILIVAVPIVCVGIFLYMSYFNSAYDAPGKYVYMNRCAPCHGDHGEGIQKLVPPLADADMAKNNLDSLPSWIIKGMNGAITVNGKAYEQPMYPITSMTEVEMANLLNYMATDIVHVNKKYKSEAIRLEMKRCGQTGI